MTRLTAIALALVLPLAAALPASANLVASWSFDEGQGTTASEDVSGFDGTLHGDSELVATGGVRGGFVDIGDAGFVLVGDYLAFTGTDAFSIQVWIKTTMTAGGTLLSRHNSGIVAGYGLGLNDPNNGGPVEPSGSFYLYQSDSAALNSGPAGLNDGEWHQVVVVRDNSSLSQIRLYVDGERVPEPTSAAALAHINPTSAPFMIGGVFSGGVPVSQYQGFIDELRVWDDALSDAEVEFLFNFPDARNTVLCGDHNLSNSLTASDAQAILRVSVGTLDGLACIADANNSGTITATDALLVLKKSVAQPISLDCPICIAGDLLGWRVESPCTSGDSPVCSSQNDVFDSVTIAGDDGVTYDVKLRLRGVVEQKSYTGGVQDGLFLEGGSPVSDGYNIVKLEISDPAATYYLNAGTSGIQRVWELDVTKTIPIRAGATVTLSLNALDSAQIANTDGSGQPIIPSGIPPAPAAFPGQFVHIEVLSTSLDQD